MRGDLLFFPPGRGNLVGNVIAKATGGPYCHVAIDLGDGTVIQARLAGVSRDQRVGGVRWHGNLPNLSRGIDWAEKQVGERYGLLDIFDQLLRLAFHTTIYIAQPRNYDCSDLATRYLIACGADVGPLADAPHLVTPNDLARQLGVQ